MHVDLRAASVRIGAFEDSIFFQEIIENSYWEMVWHVALVG